MTLRTAVSVFNLTAILDSPCVFYLFFPEMSSLHENPPLLCLCLCVLRTHLLRAFHHQPEALELDHASSGCFTTLVFSWSVHWMALCVLAP